MAPSGLSDALGGTEGARLECRCRVSPRGLQFVLEFVWGGADGGRRAPHPSQHHAGRKSFDADGAEGKVWVKNCCPGKTLYKQKGWGWLDPPHPPPATRMGGMGDPLLHSTHRFSRNAIWPWDGHNSPTHYGTEDKPASAGERDGVAVRGVEFPQGLNRNPRSAERSSPTSGRHVAQMRKPSGPGPKPIIRGGPGGRLRGGWRHGRSSCRCRSGSERGRDKKEGGDALDAWG